MTGPAASATPPGVPAVPAVPSGPSAPSTPAGPGVTGEEPSLRGKVGLPRSMQGSRDDLPPWFPRVPMRPEKPPKRSHAPLLIFAAGVLIALATVALLVLR
ncbi:MAG: hypothetical protein R3F60_12550 [bacterium]